MVNTIGSRLMLLQNALAIVNATMSNAINAILASAILANANTGKCEW